MRSFRWTSRDRTNVHANLRPAARTERAATISLPIAFPLGTATVTTADSASSREMARSLLSRETTEAEDQAARAAGLQRACTHVSENLRRSVGDDGYTALLARALRATEAKHPVLTSIRRVDGAGIYLDAVAAAVEVHGVPAVTAALEALLTSLIDLLGSLIGADMVWGLLADDTSPPQTLSEKEGS